MTPDHTAGAAIARHLIRMPTEAPEAPVTIEAPTWRFPHLYGERVEAYWPKATQLAETLCEGAIPVIERTVVQTDGWIYPAPSAQHEVFLSGDAFFGPLRTGTCPGHDEIGLAALASFVLADEAHFVVDLECLGPNPEEMDGYTSDARITCYSTQWGVVCLHPSPTLHLLQPPASVQRALEGRVSLAVGRAESAHAEMRALRALSTLLTGILVRETVRMHGPDKAEIQTLPRLSLRPKDIKEVYL